ncbi:GTP-binding protein [Colwellia sp. 1_MG-2023]|uniref:CobW family GTP-binding protein n=1 Tax=Colwellia sp. 1_MG-2023 TaxID=3062649 RepID=UPI0026E3EF1F|nr:GTP-binding protein [Colwellia sp. 1_MG-2023]MDO6446620.1 GTP-binding protein [Colwellia sp. 1_MG-2023]
MTSDNKILSVPTNIITGFLGAGKTSAILNLLQCKPENERWAILVNEFGEIGIDGSLINRHLKNTNNIFIKEVSGGCMCCASLLPMQTALNKLLKEAKPHRLLIEPTGLGHAFEVLKLLSNQYYQESLRLEKTLTLIDARKLDDSRYIENITFNQQLEIADVIVANKADLYSEQDKSALIHYVKDHDFKADKLYFTEHSQVKLVWLAGKTNFQRQAVNGQHKATTDTPTETYADTNKKAEFQSIGWRFPASKVFNQTKLMQLLPTFDAIRVKAIFLTQEGIYSYNHSCDDQHEIANEIANETFTEQDKCTESKIEIICDNIDETWLQQLNNAITM